MNRIRIAIAVLSCLLVTACGSTVQLKAQVRTDGSGLGPGTSTGGPGTTTGAVAGSSGGGAGSSGGTAGSSGGTGGGATSGSGAVTGGSSGATGATGTAGGTAGGATSRGATGVVAGSHAPIKVGVLAVDYNGLASQFGVAFPTNYFDVYRNLFGYLNKHGGIAGHQIQAVYHTANGAASDRSAEDEASCTYFTQDNHVQVVLSEIIYEPDFAACLKKKGIAQIDNGQYGLTRGDLARLGNVISPQGLTLDREAAIEFAGMTARGVLTKKSVVGVIVGGCADEVAAYNGSVVPLAKKYGFTLVENQLACYGGAAGLGEATSQIQGAILKFRSSGVDQVFAFTASEGYVLAVFMTQASNQGYHPGYLLTSNGYPYANTASESQASYPDDARPYLKGMGWQPFYDADGKPPATGGQLAAQRLCATMDPTAGGAKTATPPADVNEMQLFYSTCDDILLLEQVLTSNGVNLSINALQQGFQAASSRFTAAGPYGGRLSVTAGHPDGAILASPFSWKPGCKCVTVDGPPMTIPG